ncbi:hypothetical protein TWF106_009633 [Orbilia oligospora]|uniref:Uncharacterized protein n=1 Tax=Orbilia oligospora TaxID=2813651 RepID=A0A7C8QH50_ORBOL|nr:hypothetical protein TWF106_009633 [Orbilia oligospora]
MESSLSGPVISPPLIRHLVVDFDQTLTLQDTLSTLVTASPLPDAPEIFKNYLTKAYIEDYISHVKAYPPDRNSILSEFAFLSSLRAIERKSIERVENSNIFKGISQTAISLAAKKVQIRRPVEFTALVSKVLLHPAAKVTVLSVNWSALFIREVLNSMNLDEGHSSHHKSLTAPEFEKVEIIANNLVEDNQGFTTGKIDRWFHCHRNKSRLNGVDSGDGSNNDHGIWTADDKLQILNGLLEIEVQSRAGMGSTDARDVDIDMDTLGTVVDQANKHKSPTETTTDTVTMSELEIEDQGTRFAGYNIYVGDSPTDFAALLMCGKVHVGFIMGGEGENKSLLDMCERTGVKVLERKRVNGECGDADDCKAEDPVETYGKSGLRHRDGDLRVLYRVKGWAEIMDCLHHPEQWH